MRGGDPAGDPRDRRRRHPDLAVFQADAQHRFQHPRHARGPLHCVRQGVNEDWIVHRRAAHHSGRLNEAFRGQPNRHQRRGHSVLRDGIGYWEWPRCDHGGHSPPQARTAQAPRPACPEGSPTRQLPTTDVSATETSTATGRGCIPRLRRAADRPQVPKQRNRPIAGNRQYGVHPLAQDLPWSFSPGRDVALGGR
jgi:hypothetical protein